MKLGDKDEGMRVNCGQSVWLMAILMKDPLQRVEIAERITSNFLATGVAHSVFCNDYVIKAFDPHKLLSCL